jgi:hypothetical protein
VTDTAYHFQTCSTDPDSDQISYRVFVTGGDTTGWNAWKNSGDTFGFTVTFFTPDTYAISVQAKDRDDSTSEWSKPHLIAISQHAPPPNRPPRTPWTPNCLTTASVGVQAWFLVATSDPDTDDVAYRIDLGNGDTTDWGEYASTYHAGICVGTYQTPGTYQVRAQAKDDYGDSSGWSDPVSVTVINPTFPSRVVNRITAAAGASAVTVLPSGSHVYAATQAGLCVIRTADDVVTATVSLRGMWDNFNTLACSPDGAFVYAAAADAGMVWIVRTSDNTLVDSVPLGVPCHGLTITTDGQHLYVNSLTTHRIYVVGMSGGLVEDSVDAVWNPRGEAVLPNGLYMYAACDEGFLVVRTADNVVADSVLIGGALEGVAALPGSEYVYIIREDSIAVVATSNNTVVAFAVQQGSAKAIASALDGQLVYVPNGVWSRSPAYYGVAVIRTSDNVVVADIPVLDGADGGVVALPDGSKLYQAGGWDSGALTVIGY